MKRYFCIFIAVLMIFSCISVLPASAEDKAEIETNRYYFYFPEEWECDLSSTVYIYWWNGTNAHSNYPGVEALKTDFENLYYYDVPENVDTICWNNGVLWDEMNNENNQYRYSCYADTFNNDGKVYVLDMDKSIDHPETSGIDYTGNWYYYYGNGEYGLYKEKGEEFFSCRSFGGENPAPVPETNRYYFYMPEDWDNVLSTYAAIYWWDGTNSCENLYPGYPVYDTVPKDVYYYDVPKDVTFIMWNNNINDGTSANDVLTSPAKQTEVIDLDGYAPGENPLYPEGLENFDGMIYVIDYDKTVETWDSCYVYGDWYYYYGNGEYGTTPEKGEVFYNTRQLGNLPDKKYSNPAEGNMTIYFLSYAKDPVVCVNYTYGKNGEEITESCESTFVAKSDKKNLLSFEIPENSENVYFTSDNKVTHTITRYLNHNAVFSFGQLVNGKYDYTAKLLTETLGELDFLSGDANKDGMVTIQDVTHIQKVLANMRVLVGNAKLAADFNNDGRVTIQDATAIQKHLAKL